MPMRRCVGALSPAPVAASQQCSHTHVVLVPAGRGRLTVRWEGAIEARFLKALSQAGGVWASPGPGLLGAGRGSGGNGLLN